MLIFCQSLSDASKDHRLYDCSSLVTCAAHDKSWCIDISYNCGSLLPAPAFHVRGKYPCTTVELNRRESAGLSIGRAYLFTGSVLDQGSSVVFLLSPCASLCLVGRLELQARRRE